MAANANQMREKELKNLLLYYGTQAAISKAINCSRQAVCRWINSKGMSGPSPNVSFRIQTKTNGKIKAVKLCPSMAEYL